MFSLKDFSTKLFRHLFSKSNGKQLLFARFFGLRALLVICFLAVLLIIGISSGAQDLRTSENDSLLNKSVEKGKTKIFPNLDIRLNNRADLDRVIRANALAGGLDASEILPKAKEQAAEINKALEKLKAEVPDAEITASPVTGAIEVLRSPRALSEAAPGRDGIDIVREFIRANKDLYGLRDSDIDNLNFIGESISQASGIRMVRVEQNLNGLPIFQSETRFVLDREGRIISSLGAMIPKASAPDSALYSLKSAQETLKATMASMNIELDVNQINLIKSDDTNRNVELKANSEEITDKVTSKMVYFPVAPGVLIPAWSQIIFGKTADWYILTDAANGVVLWRKNIRNSVSTHQARFRVYLQADGSTPADNPAPQSPSAAVPGAGTQFAEILPSIASMLTVQDILASPNGWIDDCPGGVCTVNETQTLGNNALACMDANGTANVCDTTGGTAFALDGNGRPIGNPDANVRNRDFLGNTTRDFVTAYLPSPQGGAPETGSAPTSASFRRGAVTQLFYTTNWYHDKLFALGFDTAAGNFQNNNFAGGGAGNDRVLADVQDGSGTNNANFATPPDGTSGRMQMFVFTGPIVDRDGDLDAEIVIHELTHGLSNRLMGNGAGLQWDIGAGMGEGWSDYYALSLLNNTNADTPTANYASGAYATYKLGGLLDNYVYGIRRFPYSTNNAVNPLTWADVDQTTYNHSGGIAVNPLGFEFGGALEVHNVGEIWALSLWEVRARIIADPAGANGSVPTGNQTMLRIVTDAMKLTPANPTFIQARDALISADCATNACANERWIWEGFADRGLGYKAASPLAVQFGISAGHIGVKESFDMPNLDIQSISVLDNLGNNNGAIDPGEPIRLIVTLKNPWRATTASVSPQAVNATLATSTVGVTISDANSAYPTIAPLGTAAGDQFVFNVPTNATCGQSLRFTINTTSSLGAGTIDLNLRVGNPTGTGATVTYTRSALGLAIPDGNGVGVIDTLNVTDDFEIADANVQVNSLTHTYDGDVTFGIRGPSGYGTDLIALAGWGTVNGGTSTDNFTNTLIDDEAPTAAVNNLLTSTAAPYTNSYRPVFNLSTWTTLLGASPDAIPQLSRFDGTSTLGNWRVVASDHTSVDTGTLQSWSLIVTPRAFTCVPFTPTAANATISGRVLRADGTGISRARLKLTNSAGESRSITSSSFGYFVFEDVPVGETYTVEASHKWFSFTPQVINVVDNIEDLNFVAQP